MLLQDSLQARRLSWGLHKGSLVHSLCCARLWAAAANRKMNIKSKELWVSNTIFLLIRGILAWRLQKLGLTFAFFSPKVPCGIDSESGGAPMPLTKRQKEVLDYLVAFETKHGYAPSFEEIGKGLKLTSLATVHKHITTLEKKGFIRRGYNQSRSIEIVQLPKPVKEQVMDRKVQELPLVGRIAAGRPLEAITTLIEVRTILSLGG